MCMGFFFNFFFKFSKICLSNPLLQSTSGELSMLNNLETQVTGGAKWPEVNSCHVWAHGR